jgi:hypothetical protein
MAGTIAAMVAVSPVQAATCASNREDAALQARMLQTELMVAALSCNHRADYNTFVKRFNTELVQRGTTLKSYFSRAHGRSGTTQLNLFITRIANEISTRSLGHVSAFCASATGIFAQLKALPPEQFGTFVATYEPAKTHGVVTCIETAAARPLSRALPVAKPLPQLVRPHAPMIVPASISAEETVKAAAIPAVAN